MQAGRARRHAGPDVGRRGEIEAGAGGGDGEEMGVDAVRSRDGGDVNDVFKVGPIGSGVDRRRLSHGGFGQTTDAGERITTRT